MTIAEKQQKIIQEFSHCPDWEQRYQKVILLGKKLEVMADEHKTEKNLIKGCQSQVWLHASFEDGKVNYSADSDAIIVKGLAGLLIQVFSGHTPQDILTADVKFLSDIGLTSHLSQSRANGLGAMVKQFKNYALVFDVISKQ